MSVWYVCGLFVGMVLLGGWAVGRNDDLRRKAGAPPVKVNPIAKWLVIAAIAAIGTAGIAWINSFN